MTPTTEREARDNVIAAPVDWELETADDRMAVVTPTFRLEFRWTGDRWGHALHAGGMDLARALEGDTDRDDPDRVVSPAYQQLHWQRGEDGFQAMLLGQSGRHHFSAVFTARMLPVGVEVAVDVADRCRAGVRALAATYEVLLVSGNLIEADPAIIIWESAAGPNGRLSFVATEPTRIGMAEAGRRAIRVQANAQIVAGIHTQRLQYHWHWIPLAGSGPERDAVPADPGCPPRPSAGLIPFVPPGEAR